METPLKIVIYDPIKYENLHTFCMLGTVPAGVAAAASRQDRRDDKVLKAYYGTDYEKMLARIPKGTSWKSALLPDANVAISLERLGDKEVHGGDMSGLDDIEELLAEPKDVSAKKISLGQQSDISRPQDYSGVPHIEYLTAPHFYGEDKISELKEKAFIVTRIPPYRQHMFFVYKSQIVVPYNLGIPEHYYIDARTIPVLGNEIFGIPIDKNIYEQRQNIHILAADQFKLLDEINPDDRIIYIVDLAQFIAPKHSQILAILDDTYQLELLYYGFIIIFWPQLTLECFKAYIYSESALGNIYPDLAPSRQRLLNAAIVESTIVDKLHTQASHLDKWIENGNVTTAITQVTTQVMNVHARVNLRGLFDAIASTPCMPEVCAFIRMGARDDILLRKKFAMNESNISFPVGIMSKHSVTIAVSLRRSDQTSFHKRNATTTVDNEQSRYLFVTIDAYGTYAVRSMWNEEDAIGFKEVLLILRQFINPIIALINTFGSNVFTSSRKLALISAQNLEYLSMNICIFWKKVLAESSFKTMRTHIERWAQAGIFSERIASQVGKYDISFIKAMHEYDVTAIERTLAASGTMLLTNYYQYLSNSVVRQKWHSLYAGRSISVVHRTTDVRFEVMNVRENEFNVLYRYIALFMREVNESLGGKQKGSGSGSDSGIKSAAVNKMRKLREQDPELYNLKKYKSGKNYSITCQKPHQPLVYTDAEVAGMNAREKSKLVKYWNFTHGRPAYYTCPNEKYPHLSFIVGLHPKGYCLPCCNVKPNTSSRKMLINTTCLERHVWKEEDEESALSSDSKSSAHIMSYGKDLDVGRVSYIAPGIMTLFSDVGPCRLVGVEQSLPSMTTAAGILFSTALFLGVSYAEYVDELIARLKKLDQNGGTIFYVLLNGVLAHYYAGMDDFITALHSLIVTQSIIGKVGNGDINWAALFIELAYHAFDLPLVIFDVQGENIETFISPAFSDVLAQRISLGLVQNVAFLLCSSARYYPIVRLNAETYARTGEIEERVFAHDSQPVMHLRALMDSFAPTKTINAHSVLDLKVLRALGVGITRRYINLHGECHGALLESGLYIPLVPSPNLGDEPMVYGIVEEGTMAPFAALAAFITLYKPASIECNVSALGKHIGVRLKMANSSSSIIVPCGASENHPTEEMPYNPFAVDRVILNHEQAKKDGRSRLLGEALYNIYSYPMFCYEFMHHVNAERDHNIRDAMIALVKKTNFRANTDKFRDELRMILKDWPDDFGAFQRQLATFVGHGLDKEGLIQDIHASIYVFDRKWHTKIASAIIDDDVERLEKISNELGRIVAIQGKLPDGLVFPNVYTFCGEERTDALAPKPASICKDGKLILTRPIEEYVSILVADLRNPIRWREINTMLDSGLVIDDFEFVMRPSEVITAYKM